MLKFLQTDGQTDGQAKNYMPPIFRYWGIEIPRYSNEKLRTPIEAHLGPQGSY
jgi:hypothetical protein